MSNHPIETDSPDQLIVTVEQADALLEMIASEENAGRISSAALSSGLVSLGLAGANGLSGDAARILEPVRAARSRIVIRVVSPSIRGVVRDWRIWPTMPRSVVMRSDVDGVHFSQVDYCEVPHIAAHSRWASLHSRGFRHCDSFPGCTRRPGCTQRSRDIWSRGVTLRPGLCLGALERRDLRGRAHTASTVADGTAHRLLCHRPHARANPRAARRQGSRPNAVSPGAGCASTRSNLGNDDGATRSLASAR